MRRKTHQSLYSKSNSSTCNHNKKEKRNKMKMSLMSQGDSESDLPRREVISGDGMKYSEKCKKQSSMTSYLPQGYTKKVNT